MAALILLFAIKLLAGLNIFKHGNCFHIFTVDYDTAAVPYYCCLLLST